MILIDDTVRRLILVAILGLLIILWGFAGAERMCFYQKLIQRGCWGDYQDFEKADSRFVVLSCLTIRYAALGLVLTLFPLPF